MLNDKTQTHARRVSHKSPGCGAFLEPNGSVLWRVWAPQAASVELVLIDSDRPNRTQTMCAEANGFFTWVEAGIAEGQLYAFQLDGGPPRPDPASRWQPQGVHRPSAVWFPDRFLWTDESWRGVARDRLVIYELHVGTFTDKGTFEAIIPRIESLRDLGITAIELMPVAQFPGDRNWGYDAVHPFATQNSYGGPQELQRLINHCHCAGLAVILDVIYNHLGPEGNYLSEFGPYFSERYRTPWGKALNFDDRASDPVRAFVVDNVRQWIRDFHVDGLRLDAVHAIFDMSPRHILREIKEAADDEASRLGRPAHVIAESNLNDVRMLNLPERGGYGLDAQWSDDFHHSVHTLLTGEVTGYYADFGQREQLAKAINETFVYDGIRSAYRGRKHGAPVGNHTGDRFVVSIQTHDQVGNRAYGDRFGTLLTPAQQRLAAGLLLLAPNVPLLFMGEEYGEQRPFSFFCSFADQSLIEQVRLGRLREFAAFQWQGQIPDPQDPATFHRSKLTWAWPDGSWQSGLRQLYRDLLSARKIWAPLQDYRSRSAAFVTTSEGHSNVLRLQRGRADSMLEAALPHKSSNVHPSPLPSPLAARGEGGRRPGEASQAIYEAKPPEAEGKILIAYFNLAGSEQCVTDRLEDDLRGRTILLSSEQPRYAGRSESNCSATSIPDYTLRPFEFFIIGSKSWTADF